MFEQESSGIRRQFKGASEIAVACKNKAKQLKYIPVSTTPGILSIDAGTQKKAIETIQNTSRLQTWQHRIPPIEEGTGLHHESV